MRFRAALALAAVLAGLAITAGRSEGDDTGDRSRVNPMAALAERGGQVRQ